MRRSWWDPDRAAGSIFLQSGHRGMNWWDISGCRDSPALTVTALTNCSLQLLLPTTSARFVFLISLSTVLCRDTDGKNKLLMQRSLAPTDLGATSCKKSRHQVTHHQLNLWNRIIFCGENVFWFSRRCPFSCSTSTLLMDRCSTCCSGC